MHSEKVMAKKSKPPVKVEKAVVKEETEVVREEAQESVKEETNHPVKKVRELMLPYTCGWRGINWHNFSWFYYFPLCVTYDIILANRCRPIGGSI